MPVATVRGKKKVIETVAVPVPVPVVEVPTTAAAEPVVEEQVPVVTNVPTPATKKKLPTPKKPIKVIAVVTANGIEGSFAPESRRPLIAHLQINTNDIDFNTPSAPRYDPDPSHIKDPEPYNPADLNPFETSQEQLPFTVQGTITQNEVEANAIADAVEKEARCAAATAAAALPPVVKALPCFMRADLMLQFKGAAEDKRLPSSTDISCFWCTHEFEGMPCVIPEREVAGIYTVYGNFCCPECAVAYLLSEGLDPHVRWERMALLHRIYDSHGNGRIFPAPPRESLKIFGGPMSIDVYRITMREKKVRVDLHMPPMVSILGSIDTKPIDFFDTNLKHSGPIVAAPATQRSVEEGLRLKRNKPLKDKESTLDTVMNIRIGTAARR